MQLGHHKLVTMTGRQCLNIVDGRVLHAILLEMFTDDAGVGTLFTA